MMDNKFWDIAQIVCAILLGTTITFNLCSGYPVYWWAYAVFIYSFMWMLFGNKTFVAKFPYFRNMFMRKGDR